MAAVAIAAIPVLIDTLLALDDVDSAARLARTSTAHARMFRGKLVPWLLARASRAPPSPPPLLPLVGARVRAAFLRVGGNAATEPTSHSIVAALRRDVGAPATLAPSLFGTGIERARTDCNDAYTLARAVLVYALGWTYMATAARRRRLPFDCQSAIEAIAAYGPSLSNDAMDALLADALGVQTPLQPLCAPARRFLACAPSPCYLAWSDGWRSSLCIRAPSLLDALLRRQPNVERLYVNGSRYALPSRLFVDRFRSRLSFEYCPRGTTLVPLVTARRLSSCCWSFEWAPAALSLDALGSDDCAPGTLRRRLEALFDDATVRVERRAQCTACGTPLYRHPETASLGARCAARHRRLFTKG